jgi:hypothetical protein
MMFVTLVAVSVMFRRTLWRLCRRNRHRQFKTRHLLSKINKSDRNDAIGIARILQTSWFKEVHVKNIDRHSVARPWSADRTPESAP